MDSHQWFQQLRNALHDQGVPFMYANRLMDELWHHYLETKEQEEMNGFVETKKSITERLGSPESLAAQAASVSQSSWVGRHAWLTFVLGTPLMAFGLILVCIVLSAFALGPFVEGRTMSSDPWMKPLMLLMGPLQVILPSLLVCGLMLRLAHKSYSNPWWGVLSCGLIAALSLVTQIVWSFPEVSPGTGRLYVGIGTPVTITYLQSMLPIVLGVVYGWRNLPPRKPLSECQPLEPKQAAA